MSAMPRHAALLMLQMVAVIDSINIREDPYSEAAAFSDETVTAGARTSDKYLVASFPVLKQVAYVRPPDTVWRPLVIGSVAEPSGVAVDPQMGRLFLADPPNNVIWAYTLRRGKGRLLETVGSRWCAVEGFRASWLTVNFGGDLYFTGHDNASTQEYESIYRQDFSKLQRGDSLNPAEVYSRTSSGHKAWAPSGIAADSFYLFWGNSEGGQEHGSVCRSESHASGRMTTHTDIAVLNNAIPQVRSMTVTGTHIFWLSPSGVYGMPKSTPYLVSDPDQGFITGDPTNMPTYNTTLPWDPFSVSWDGDASLYVSDVANGIVYMLPAVNVRSHGLTKYVDAPNIYDIAVMQFRLSGTARAAAAHGALALSLAATVFAALARGT